MAGCGKKLPCLMAVTSILETFLIYFAYVVPLGKEDLVVPQDEDDQAPVVLRVGGLVDQGLQVDPPQ